MPANTIRSWIREGILAVLLTLVFFLGLQAILSTVFPSATGLGALMAGMQGTTPDAEWGGAQDLRSQGFGDQTSLAVLSRVHNVVKTRSASSVAWGAGQRGLELHDRDAVQTLDRSRASITFHGAGELELGPNTHIVLSGENLDIFSARSGASLLMIDGELRGRLVSHGGTPASLDITLPRGTTRIGGDPAQGGAAEFRIQVRPDQSASVAVDKGTAEVAADGDTVEVPASSFSTIPAAGAPRTAESLARPIRTLGPSNGAIYPFRSLSPRITFAWEPGNGFSGYRVRFARDAAFRDVVHDETVTEPELVLGTLGAGTYYWQVLGIRDGFEVTLQSTSRVTLTQSAEPPALEVAFPTGVVKGDSFVLTGSTEPGMKVLVGGQPAAVDPDGRFAYRLGLKPGVNVVVVESMDEVGNVAYRSQTVNSKP